MKTTTVILATLLVSACVSYEREQHFVTGSLTNLSLLSHISPGETTTDWLLIHAGKPEFIAEGHNGEQRWTYSSQTRSQTKVRALPLVAVRLQDEQKTLYHFAVRDSVVTSVSQERVN